MQILHKSRHDRRITIFIKILYMFETRRTGTEQNPALLLPTKEKEIIFHPLEMILLIHGSEIICQHPMVSAGQAFFHRFRIHKGKKALLITGMNPIYKPASYPFAKTGTNQTSGKEMILNIDRLGSVLFGINQFHDIEDLENHRHHFRTTRGEECQCQRACRG